MRERSPSAQRRRNFANAVRQLRTRSAATSPENVALVVIRNPQASCQIGAQTSSDEKMLEGVHLRRGERRLPGYLG